MPDAMIVEYHASFGKVVPEGDQRWGFLVCVLFARVVRTDDELGEMFQEYLPEGG